MTKLPTSCQPQLLFAHCHQRYKECWNQCWEDWHSSYPVIASKMWLHRQSVGKVSIGLSSRLEHLYWVAARGNAIHIVAQRTRDRVADFNTLETYANYCIGLVLIGSAAARRSRGLTSSQDEARLFRCESQYGAFWRFLAIVQAGGITLDAALGKRLFDGATVRTQTEQNALSESNLPIKFSVFRALDGFTVHSPGLTQQALIESFVRDVVISLLPSFLLNRTVPKIFGYVSAIECAVLAQIVGLCPSWHDCSFHSVWPTP